jgi:hypothetical protein
LRFRRRRFWVEHEADAPAAESVSRRGGGGALIHKARGRTSNNWLIPGIGKYVIELVRSRYDDFGPIMGAEVLFEKDGVKVSRETLQDSHPSCDEWV